MSQKAATPRVLVVDFQEPNLKLLGELVSDEGAEFLTARGSAEALDILAREDVDLVLLDLMMPNDDTMTVLSELQKRGSLPALPVVVVSAVEHNNARLDALAAGAAGSLAKPIDRAEVSLRIRSLLELKRLRDAELKNVRAVLSETETRSQARARNSPIAEVEWTPEFVVSSWNPAAARLFGYTECDAVSMEGAALLPDLKGGKPWDAFKDQTPQVYLGRATARDGTTSICEWHFAPVFASDGSLLSVVSVVIDATAREQEREALAQARTAEAIEQLAGGIAHDFNNLLASILSFGSLARDGISEDHPSRADLDEVLVATKKAASLTRQLLAFSQQRPADREKISPFEQLERIRPRLARALGSRCMLEVTNCESGDCWIEFGSGAFEQVSIALVENARDAMTEGGTLRIEVSVSGDQASAVRISFRDTGHGMDEETLARATEPFFSTKRRLSGTGLGLSSVVGIVAASGGSMWLESKVGHGTSVHFEFPRRDAPSQRRGTTAATSQAESAHGGGKRVLVVEDEAPLRSVTERYLVRAGYVVVTASDGEGAIAKLDAEGDSIDLVLTDIIMPGRSGYDVRDHVHQTRPQLPVLLTSGYMGSDPRKDDDPDILWKPVAPELLVQAVYEKIHHSSAPGAQSKPDTKSPTSGHPPPYPTLSAPSHPPLAVVMDDDEGVQRVLRRMLERAGWKAEMASTIAETKECLGSVQPPSLIFCDLTLPDGNGSELIEWLREEHSDFLPAVTILTGGALRESDVELEASGEFAVLTKPINTGEFDALLSSRRRGIDAKSAPGRAPSLIESTNAQTAVRRGGVVLIVEDDPTFAKACARILERGRYDTEIAGSVAEASVALARQEFDALLLDFELPDGTGLDLLTGLPAANARTPAIVLTRQPSIESASRAVSSRVRAYLPKPVEPSTLLSTLRKAIDSARVERLRNNLLAARFGGELFLDDLSSAENLLDRAIGEISMAYQPIVRASDGSIFGYEALLRCGVEELASPVQLLAAAEMLGRIHDVGRAVRASVASTLEAHGASDTAVFVNVHPSEFRGDILGARGAPLQPFADRIVLEVTERASLNSDACLAETLETCRSLGYRVALDDLGEGYAGLTSLVVLGPEFVKIDMSLVRSIDRTPLKRRIVEAIVTMARASNILVVAEGVETRAEFDTLRSLGCDFLQGYFLARPGPPFPSVNDVFGP